MESTPHDGRVRLPGFGLPLEQSSEIPTATDGWFANPITVRERTMIALMATLKDKPDWTRKVFDNEIVDKWRLEAINFGKSMTAIESRSEEDGQTDDDDDSDRRNGESIEFDGSDRQKLVSERMFDYCIAELREAAESLDKIGTGITAAIDANAVVCMSDIAVSHATKEKLKAAILPLENVPESKKDWHPGSDGKVLNIVHPSICPLVYGRTRILPEAEVPLMDCHTYTGKGEVIPAPDDTPPYYSGDFQWLPCEVRLDDGNKATITSYINNLHPSGNEDLYSAIEEIITQAIPLWIGSVVSTIVRPSEDRMEDVGDGYITHHEDLEEEEEEWDSTREENFVLPEPKKYGDRTRGSASDLGDAITKIQTLFREKGLQVIVKLANIHLNPDKPKYDGGSWHIEGMSNEQICASALYYYDEENITPSYLAFRELVDRDILHDKAEQSREWGYCAVYGIEEHWGDALQVLGKIRTREDRLLAFPNVLQHRLSPFQLADPTKPGHRKILALFLVDPNIKIPSTANVPPQQAELWIQGGQMDCVFGRFPVEIADQIIDSVDFPFSREEAERIREKLIEERKAFVEEVDDYFKENRYNFCEH